MTEIQVQPPTERDWAAMVGYQQMHLGKAEEIVMDLVRERDRAIAERDHVVTQRDGLAAHMNEIAHIRERMGHNHPEDSVPDAAVAERAIKIANDALREYDPNSDTPSR